MKNPKEVFAPNSYVYYLSSVFNTKEGLSFLSIHAADLDIPDSDALILSKANKIVKKYLKAAV